MSPRCEAANSCVRVSKRRSVSVSTNSKRTCCRVSTETISCCLDPTLFPWHLTCSDCRHHAKWTHQTGPTFHQFPELQQIVDVVDKIAKTTRMMCWYLLMVGMTSCCACAAWSGCLSNQFFVSGHLLEQLQQFGAACSEKSFDRAHLVQVGGHVTNPKDWDTTVRLRGYKTRHVQQHRLATVSDRARWQAKLEECWRVLETNCSRIGCAEQEITISSDVCLQTWLGTSIVVVEECF